VTLATMHTRPHCGERLFLHLVACEFGECEPDDARSESIVSSSSFYLSACIWTSGCDVLVRPVTNMKYNEDQGNHVQN
jgi:hypothetical protein